MISHALRNLYYGVMRGPMWVNGRLYKALRQPNDGTLNVHLGCGKVYIPGWLNADANIVSAKIDLWVNFLDELPFRDNSVDRLYSFHVVEHLPEHHLATHFADMFRCLKPGGGIRVGGPHIENAARKFAAGDLAWFCSDFPIHRKSIGGRFANFVFCSGEHLTALSPSFLRELAEDAGFIDFRTCLPIRESTVVGQEVLSTEWEDDFECPKTVVIEARKPKGEKIKNTNTNTKKRRQQVIDHLLSFL